MKLQTNKRQMGFFIFLFLFLNILNTFFLTTEFLNGFLITFERSFISELISIIGNLSILLFFMFIIFMIFKKMISRMTALTVFTFLLNLFTFGLYSYTRHFQTAFSIWDWSFAKNPVSGLTGDVALQIGVEFFTRFMFLMFIPFVALLIFTLIINHKYKTRRRKTPKIYLAPQRAIRIFLFMFVSLLTSLFSFVYSNYRASQIWPINSETDQFGVQTAGVYNYYFYEIFSFNLPNIMKEKNPRPLEDYDYLNKNKESYQNIFDETYSNILLESDASSAFINPKIANLDHSINGILKDKNIILVQLETFNHFLLEENGPYLDETFMPYLKELLSKSYYLSNFYTNVGVGHSSDAEFASQTGLVPEGSITLFWDYEKNEYDFISISEALSNYYSASLHADNKLFYNRENIYDEIFSFKELYYYLDDVNDTDPYNVINAFPNQLDKTNPNSPWLSEKSLFQWTKSLADRALNNNDNFYLFPITVHPHTPFKYDPYEDMPIFTSKDIPNVDSTTLKMLNYSQFYDDIIRYLVELTNSLSDTVLIAYADHGTGFSLNDVRTILGDFELSDLEVWNEINKTFAFIYYPDPDEPNNPDNPYQIKESMIKGNQTLVRSQIDVYRTILELTDTNQDIFYYGTNLLSDEHTFSYHAKTNMVTTDKMIISLKKYLSNNQQINQKSVYFFDNYLSDQDVEKYADYFLNFRLITSQMILNNQAYQLSYRNN